MGTLPTLNKKQATQKTRPKWFYPYCKTPEVIEPDEEDGQGEDEHIRPGNRDDAVMMGSDDVQLHISKRKRRNDLFFELEYELLNKHSSVNFSLELSREEFFAAFDLGDPGKLAEDKDSLWHQTVYTCDVAVQGKFIRLGNWLNIPCPGTGRQGDPNLSLCLNDEIKEAVRILGGE